MEKVIETKICKCGNHFDITDKDIEFYDKVSPIFGGVKYNIPSPNLCPDCRQQKRMAWRNERRLYRRNCDATGKEIISIYSEDKQYKIYSHEEWCMDNWDPMSYGKDFDFSKRFFEQFEELFKNVPKRAVTKGNALENCNYVNGIGSCKNCYLLFDASNSVNCYYGNSLDFSEDCMDGYNMKDCIGCYELIDCIGCYICSFSENSLNCKDSSYLYNCTNCTNCFGCVNLNNKQFYIFNEEYSEKEYETKVKKLKESKDLSNTLNKFKVNFPYISNTLINSENVLGDFIYNSKDVYNSFEIKDSANIRYSIRVYGDNNDIEDTFKIITNCSRVYDCGVIYKNCYGVIHCFDCWKECENILYSTESKALKNSFGCHGLTNKSYCILNKQYTKEEYEALLPKIIEHMKKTGEWGEFFPSSISPFGYNETVAMEYFPISKNEATEKGFKWSDYEPPFPKVEKVIPASKLPNEIKDIPDDIVNWAVECEVTGKPFRIIKQELDFYRKHDLPIPKRSPEQRHIDRINKRKPRKLFERNCMKCGKEINTSYGIDRPEIIYCVDCYKKEVI